MTAETKRQIVHITMVGWALLLRVLTWPQAAALAVTALVFNAIVLPRIGGRALYRAEDVARGVPAGIVFYPISVLLLILVFRARLDIAAAAWAILAFGDGVATIAGRGIRSASLPWNGDKTVAGTTMFAVTAALGAIGLCWWTQPALAEPAPPGFIIGAPIAAALVAALVESMPVRLDDNLSVPFAAGATLWVASLLDAGSLEPMLPIVRDRVVPALVVNATLATAAFAAGTVSTSGAIVGVLIGLTIYLATGLTGWVMLFAAFAAAAFTSKIGWRRKLKLGIAQERAGRRGAGNALANCLVSAVAALVAVASSHDAAAYLALVTGLTAGGSDTVASEIGKAWGRSTFLPIGLRPVRPGTSGAMSLEGTLAGMLSAFLLAGLGTLLGLIPAAMIWIVVVGATSGALVESVLGATLEKPGILDNDLLNFINTAVAVAVALLIL